MKENDVSLESIVKNSYQEKTIVDMKIPDLKAIGIASDHRGYKLKQKLTKYLCKKGYHVIDYGTDSTVSVDYPLYGIKLGEAVASLEVPFGIAICGSGIGISIACNKVKGVRCAKVSNIDDVKWTRRDNDANIIAFSAKTPLYRAKDMIDVFLKEKFSNISRHQNRIDMIKEYEDKHAS